MRSNWCHCNVAEQPVLSFSCVKKWGVLKHLKPSWMTWCQQAFWIPSKVSFHHRLTIELIVESQSLRELLTEQNGSPWLRKKWELEEKNWLKSSDLKGLKFGFGKGSCFELVWGGQMARLVLRSWYQTSSWLVQGLAELLWDGIAAVCVPRLPESLCVRGLLRSWQSSTAHTDSTLLLTGATARLWSKHTYRQKHGCSTYARTHTQIHTCTNDG